MDSIVTAFPQWRVKTTIGALKIATVIPNPRGAELHFEDARYVPIQVDAGWLALNGPGPGEYLISHPGYPLQIVTGEEFEAHYELAPNTPKENPA